MNYQVVIPHSVFIELEEVTIYYESKQKDLGLKFVSFWETAMAELKRSPLLYQKKHKHLRTIKISKFPYLLVFEILADKIYVYRLIHVRKHPRKIYKQ